MESYAESTLRSTSGKWVAGRALQVCVVLSPEHLSHEEFEALRQRGDVVMERGTAGSHRWLTRRAMETLMEQVREGWDRDLGCSGEDCGLGKCGSRPQYLAFLVLGPPPAVLGAVTPSSGGAGTPHTCRHVLSPLSWLAPYLRVSLASEFSQSLQAPPSCFLQEVLPHSA